MGVCRSRHLPRYQGQLARPQGERGKPVGLLTTASYLSFVGEVIASVLFGHLVFLKRRGCGDAEGRREKVLPKQKK